MKLGYGSALGYVMALLIFALSYAVIRRYYGREATQ
jgi:ABC-type sugar transport system permease subunit